MMTLECYVLYTMKLLWSTLNTAALFIISSNLHLQFHSSIYIHYLLKKKAGVVDCCSVRCSSLQCARGSVKVRWQRKVLMFTQPEKRTGKERRGQIIKDDLFHVGKFSGKFVGSCMWYRNNLFVNKAFLQCNPTCVFR